MAARKVGSKNGKVVVMSEMDFEIAKSVYKMYNEVGLHDEEVSFLLGKPNKYVFGLINPTKKEKFKTEQIDMLPGILQCTFRKLIPNDLRPDIEIQVRATVKTVGDKLTFKYTTQVTGEETSATGKFEKKIRKGDRKQLHQAVHALTLQLISEGHFFTPKNALELYYLYKTRINTPFNPADVQKSLADCLRSDEDKSPSLERVIVNARYYYKEIDRNIAVNN